MDIVLYYNSISLGHIYDRNVKRKPPPQKLKNNKKTGFYLPTKAYLFIKINRSFIHSSIHPRKYVLVTIASIAMAVVMWVCACVCSNMCVCNDNYLGPW